MTNEKVAAANRQSIALVSLTGPVIDQARAMKLRAEQSDLEFEADYCEGVHERWDWKSWREPVEQPEMDHRTNLARRCCG